MTTDFVRILILDDDEGDRRAVKRSLEQAKVACECIEASTIEEALDEAQTPFHCAFIDYRLPGWDGLAGVTALRERFPHLAVIMLTGQGDEMVATEAMKRGASDYMPKCIVAPQTIHSSLTTALQKAVLKRKIHEQHAELEVFNRILVHDLKEPLASIQSFASLADDAAQTGRLKNLSEYSRRIKTAAMRSASLIDVLNQYTQVDEVVAFEDVDLSNLMEDVVSSLSDVIERRGARVAYFNLPTVRGNAPQLAQLLQNLVANGIKYCTDPCPTIEVYAAAGEVANLVISVCDNGIGIPLDQCLRIFEPFHRLHGKSKYEGSGLGLATCRKIVERHGGHIWCESVEGEGSTFRFTLMEQSSECATPSVKASDLPAGQRSYLEMKH